jgi:hypothetical protein
MNGRIVMAVAAVLVAGAFVSARQRPAEPTTGTAVIAGRVVDGVSGRPVPGVRISLSRDPYVTGLPGATSGADGAFVISELPLGAYTVWATRPGYLEGRYGARLPLAEGLSVRVGDGGRRTGLEIRMWPSAAVSGRILDEQGRPVAGVRVQALQRRASAGGCRYASTWSDTTNDRGEYRISRLTPGEYVTVVPFRAESRVLSAAPAKIASAAGAQKPRGVSTRGDGYLVDPSGRTIRLPYGPSPASPADDRRSRVYVTSFPNGVTLRSAAPIHLDAGEERDGVDIQLHGRNAVNVSGTITGPDGPIPGAVLQLTPDDFDGPSYLASFTANAHSDGSFTFLLVPAGRYTLTATRRVPPLSDVDIGASGHALIPQDCGLSDDAESWWTSTPIAIGDADVDDLVLTFQRGTRVSGQVRLEGPAEADTGESPPITVSFSQTDERFGGTSARMEPDGRFTARMRPGSYALGIRGLASPWTFKTAIVHGREVGAGPVVVTAEDLADVVVVLTNRPAAIAGSVTAQTTSDAAIVLFPAEREAWSAPPASGVFGSAAPWRAHRTRAEDGRFTLEQIVPGEYFVAAIDEAAMADWPTPSFLEWVASRATRITLTEGERRTLALETRRR